MFKSNGGFTLVELIVVIAILAILAGIAVPAYSGYINKAKQAGDMQVLSSVSTAAQGLAAGEGATVSKIEVEGTTVKSVTAADAEGTSVTVDLTEVAELTGALSFSTGFESAEWSNTDGWDITYGD